MASTSLRPPQNGTAPRVIVASARSIAQILSPEIVHEPFVLTRGAEIDRDQFIEGLVSMGYRREQLVEHRAEIAVRGGIVDVWPAHADEAIALAGGGEGGNELRVAQDADRGLRAGSGAARAIADGFVGDDDDLRGERQRRAGHDLRAQPGDTRRIQPFGQ